MTLFENHIVNSIIHKRKKKAKCYTLSSENPNLSREKKIRIVVGHHNNAMEN